MKFDETEVISSRADGNDYYLKSEADKVIAELKELKAHAEDDIAFWKTKCEELKAENERLNKELEHVKNGDCINTCDVLEKYGKELRQTRRALWLARAKAANEAHFMWSQFIYDRKYGIVKFNVKKEWLENVKQGQTLHTPQGWADVWDKVEYKCLKKAEEYK